MKELILEGSTVAYGKKTAAIRYLKVASLRHGETMFNQPVDSARELLLSYHAGEREFKGAYLEGANLQGACLKRARLIGANLVRANLKDANLQQANLVGADLSNADLQGVHLEGANLNGANLDGTNLKEANCDGAVMPNGSIRWSGLNRS